MTFPKQPSKPNFFELQQVISAYWKNNHLFEKSVENRSPDKSYRFYDGPPFITGVPHYGTLLSSIIKDVIPRYQTMRGHRVERVFGWDCHGIPIEQKVMSKHGIAINRDIEEKIGIETFINECYDYTKANTESWAWYIDNIGRWVEFEKSYKTQDNDYMESVWRVFKQLREKGYVYKGKKVFMYSTKLATPISNFEVAMDDTYGDVNDPAITVKFKLSDRLTFKPKETDDSIIDVSKFGLSLPEGYTIEYGQAKDAADIYNTFYKSWSETYVVDGGITQEDVDHKYEGRINLTSEEASARFEKRINKLLVAKLNGIVIGVNALPTYDESGKPEIKGLYLLNEHQGKGLAKALMTINESLSSESEMYVKVADFNQKAIDFYKSMGYEVVEGESEQMNFPSGSVIREVIMRKDLANIVRSDTLAAHPQNDESKSIPTELENVYVLAWTTTPWTIPANLALAVNRGMTYDIVKMDGDETSYYITASTRTEHIFKNKPHQIISQLSGSDLEGKAYSAPFMYYEGYNPLNHHIYHADRVSDSDGTGIVHCAPEFGESDYQLGQSVGLTMTEALDKEGNYTAQVEGHDDVSEFSLVGKYYRDCNDQIIEELKKLGRLFDKASITHRVAFCPRTNVPLIYKAIDSWMIDIKKLKPKLLERNQDINWYPEHFKNGRFANSIESAPDWNISRSRYWGTPMPIYAAEGSTDDFMIIGSREELYELCKSGSNAIEKRDTVYRDTTANKELDMHRPWIDNHWFVKDGKTYKRISDVFDCWMESASMPYAQLHYPFENKEKFDNNFPGDFVVEYTGQIRAWFYVMHVIGVALFDKAPFKHVLTTGVLAGNDGRKMSKSYGNFVDPQEVIPQFGGEAIRMILANSPVSYGGDTALKDEYFLDMTKRFMLPVWNSFSFLTTYANLDNRTPSSELVAAIKADDWSKVTNDSTNILDRWIITLCKKLLDDVSKGLEEYSLVDASGALISFVDNLTNWYIRRSRRRFWKSEHDGDKNSAYQTLYIVMILFCKAAAPFVPFIADYIYKTLVDGMDTSTDHSIHLTNWPDLSHIPLDQSLLDSVSVTQAIVSGGLSARAQQNVRVRQPLSTLTIDRQLTNEAISDIKDELNIKNIVTNPSIATLVTQIIKVNAKLVGAKLGGRVQEIIKKGKEGQFVLQADGTAQIDDVLLQANEFEINYLTGDRTDIFVTDGIVYSIDMTITPELEIEGLARDLIRSIQEQRKEAGYELSDRIKISLSGADNIIAAHREMIQDETLSTITDLVDCDLMKEYEIGGNTVTVMVLR